jgi:hypothetical protein
VICQVGIYALFEVEKDDVDDAVRNAKGGVTQYNEDGDRVPRGRYRQHTHRHTCVGGFRAADEGIGRADACINGKMDGRTSTTRQDKSAK